MNGPRPDPTTPEEFFAGRALGLAVFERIRAALAVQGPVDVRVSRSQVAFRRRRGFAYLWAPGQYLAKPTVEVVLSIALGRADPSPRFKQVLRVAPIHWMHHLELHDLAEIDEEVVGWLLEAAARAG